MIVERKRKIKAHAQLMLAAFVLNIISFVAVMGPAWDNVGEGASSTMGIIAMGHVSSGGLALLLSFWVVGSWLLMPLLAKPLKISRNGALNKKLMWAVLFLWLASLILGFFLHAMLNMGLLGSFPVPVSGN
jgi:uncharacterized membrane protein YozB (DUF420 family)